MRKSIWIYIISIILVEALGFLVGMLTRSGTRLYADTIVKPPLAPPGMVFPIAWTILYAFMAIGIVRIVLSAPSLEKKRAIFLFIAQLILNLAWCFIFFGAQAYYMALVELVIMLIAVVAMTWTFKKIDMVAAMLQVPYMIWLCFAMYLNAGVAILNVV